MFCTTVIPTIGRDSLQRAVCSVLQQQFSAEPFEVIVVNDSGQPLTVEPWHRDPRVTIITTNRRRVVVARNAGAALAKGRFVHFLDDDDWLLPNALQKFWQMAQQKPTCALIYGGYCVQGAQCSSPLAERNFGVSGNLFAHIVGGTWLPTMTVFVKTETFFAVGGFDPTFDLNSEDIELWSRIALDADFAHIDATVSVLWRETGSNSPQLRVSAAPESNRRARDRALSQPGAFKRLRQSANTPYWRGRVLRAYITTMLWRMRRWQAVHAVSRGLLAVAWSLFSLRSMISAEFWQALRAHTVLWSDSW